MLRSKTIPQTQIIPAEESDDGIITAAILESRLIETKDLIGLDIEDVQESIDKKTEGYFVSLINQMQGVNNNLEAISDTIRRDMRDRKKYFDMQKELFEDDEENLKKLRSRSGGGGNLFGGLLNKSLLGLGLFSAGGIIPQLFPNTVKTETDKNVDLSIEEKGGEETVDDLIAEEKEKKEERNFIQNFFYGKIIGEDAEYDKQIERAEAESNQDVKSDELAEPQREDIPDTSSGAKIFQDSKKSFEEASKQISETTTDLNDSNITDNNISEIETKTSSTLNKELSNFILDKKELKSNNKFEDILEMSSDISDGGGGVSFLNIEGTTKKESVPIIDTGSTNAQKNIDFDPEKSGQERFETSISLGVF